jgi:hypothetical protein
MPSKYYFDKDLNDNILINLLIKFPDKKWDYNWLSANPNITYALSLLY